MLIYDRRGRLQFCKPFLKTTSQSGINQIWYRFKNSLHYEFHVDPLDVCFGANQLFQPNIIVEDFGGGVKREDFVLIGGIWGRRRSRMRAQQGGARIYIFTESESFFSNGQSIFDYC